MNHSSPAFLRGSGIVHRGIRRSALAGSSSFRSAARARLQPAAALITLLAPLALGFFVASFSTEHVLHKHLFLSLSIVLSALALQPARGTQTRVRTMSDTSDKQTQAPTSDRMDPQTSNHALIEGTFSHSDAQEILLSLLNFKIDHHRLRTFSSMERRGKPDHASEVRIQELEATKASVQAALAKAIDSDVPIRISSTIQVTFGAEPLHTGKAETMEAAG